MAISQKLTAVADAIREKTGKSDLMTLAEMPEEIRSIMANYSNPNLLDNWYFCAAVNQRGQSSYSVNNYGYTIDRWMQNNANSIGTVTVRSVNLKIAHAADGGVTVFAQRLENPPTGTVTMSILFADGTIETVTGQLGNMSGTHLRSNSEAHFQILCSSGEELRILAVKLELGTQQTLAHQENGVWVLNDVPNYGDELAKCQRYFVNLALAGDHYYVGAGVTRNGICYFALSTPAAMRALPSVIEMGAAKKLEIYSDTGAHPATNFGLNSLIGNQIRGSCSCSLPDSTNYLQFQNVALTAEL